jgi:hypothetical protein
LSNTIIEVEQESVLEVARRQQLMLGLATWVNPINKFTILDLEAKADPNKRSEAWRIETAAGMPKNQFNREYGDKWIVYEGRPVYNDFDPDVHVARGKIVVPRFAKLISGWDAGPNDVHDSWVLGVTGRENSILVIDNYNVDNGDIYDLVDTAQERLSLEWSKLGGFCLHVCDQAVFTRSNVIKGGRSVADILRERGMAPMPGEQLFGKRRNFLASLMMQNYKSMDGVITPKFRIHERCEKLIDAFNGGYAYPKGTGNLKGEFLPKPLKNLHSHPANATEYMVSRVNIAHQVNKYDGRPLPKRASSF